MSEDARGQAATLEEVSQRLRSPLTSLITYLCLMERRLEQAAREGGGEQLREYAELEAAALADAYQMGEALDQLLGRRVPPSVPAKPSQGPTREVHVGDRRFDRHWGEWDARLARGQQPLEILRALTDHQLAELLAADAGARRHLERNIIATQLRNRLSKRATPPSDALVASMARLIAQASHTASNTRRIIADSSRARTQAAQRRALRSEWERADDTRRETASDP